MPNSVPDILNVFAGWQIGDWAWCLHCERVYKVGEFRLIGDLQMCPYPDCDGDTVLDCIHWEDIVEKNGYEAIPQRGVEYPLYGRKNED